MDSEFWDDDICHLNLSDVEKNGLQVYRNYKRSFLEHQQKYTKAEIDAERQDLSPLSKVQKIIEKSDLVMLPIVVCAYADDLIGNMFNREIPENIPGGKKTLFDSFGPLSNLSARIKVAYCFNCLNQDLLHDLDLLRKVRNKISHSWDFENLKSFHLETNIQLISRLSGTLSESSLFSDAPFENLNEAQLFRINLLWIVARLFYECLYFFRLKKQLIDPYSFLYGINHPEILTEISQSSINATKEILFNQEVL